MSTETKHLIPIMLIDDKSKYIMHESTEEGIRAAANELGECLKNAMSDCYVNNTMTKEAYIGNIQTHFGKAVHQLTFEPDMEITLVDQYGRPWVEVGNNQSMTSPLTGDRTVPTLQPLINPLGSVITSYNEKNNNIPVDIIIDYCRQKMKGIENPNIDILALGKGPLSYEGAKNYIENDSMYPLTSNKLLYPVSLISRKYFQFKSNEENKTSEVFEELKKISNLDDQGINLIANMERNVSQINVDTNTGKIISVPTIYPDVGYGHDINENPIEPASESLSANEALEL